jgi:hypothetical protein
MANTIILKRSATPGKVPTTSQLALGEIAINTYDGLIYIKKDDGTPSIAQIGGVTSVNSKTGTAVLDSDDISDSGKTNKWFSNTLARGAVSAGTGISYNSGTGVISTSQNIATSASPTFAGLTLTGNMGITGNIVPSSNNTYSLGSPTYQWKDLYVGPGTLYVNGKAVISDTSGTMTFSTDVDQNMRITTQGAGVLQLGSSSTNVNVDGTLQMGTGKRITDGAGVNVQFGNAVHMNSNKITNVGAPSANTDAATKGYVDTTVAAISTSTISQGNSSVAVVDSGTGTVTVTVDGSTALTVDATGVTVAGNFTVSGTQTTVNANTIALADNIITLNSDATGTPTQNAGIEVERGDEANVQVRWNEGGLKWTFTNDGATYNPIPVSTTDLTEGTNQYFTTARARGALSATSATGVSFNSTTGVISLGSIPNSALSNNSITINGTSVALGGTRTLDTDAVSEGSTNTYFTNTRARGAVSATAGTGLSYNSSTGAFSLASIPNSSLTNTTVTVGTTGIALGATSTTLAGLTSVSATTFTGALSGNATTATTLQNARTINGVSFDGSANVTTLTAGTGITVTGTAVAVDSTIATKTYVDTAVAGKDNTDEITEGTTNLYFTNARARAAITASTGITVTSGVVAIDSTVTTLTGTQTLTNKTLTSPAVTTPTITGATVLKTGSTSVADEYVAYLSASATTANQVLDSLATASYTSARYLIEAVTASDVEMVEVVLAVAGANVYLNSTSMISSSTAFQATYDADISGGNVRLLVTPTNANTKFKVRATAFKVI